MPDTIKNKGLFEEEARKLDIALTDTQKDQFDRYY